MSGRVKTNQSKNTTKPIYSFFPKSKSAVNIPGDANDFYNQHLPKVSQNSANSESSQQLCENENQKLKEEMKQIKAENSKLRAKNQKLHTDLAGLLKVHKETCRLYVNKEIKVKLLEKKVIPHEGLLYETFKKDLSESLLIQLRKLKIEQRSDSSFILACMRHLFQDPNELKSLSACGKSQNSTLPPKEREILDAILLERLSSENIADSEKSFRYLRLNRLINSAIANMTRATKVIYSFHIGHLPSFNLKRFHF